MSIDRALLAVLAALFLVAPMARAAPPAAIGPVAAADQEVVVAGDVVRLRLPIALRSGVRVSQLYAEVTDVDFPTRRERRFFNAFSAKVNQGRNGRGPSVHLDVDTNPALPAGAYKVSMRVRLREPAAPRGRTVTLEVRIAAAQLKPPATVQITRTLPLHGDARVVVGPLVLRESTGRSRVTGIDLLAGAATTNAGEQRGGTITAQADQPISPGGRLAVPLQTSGGFPVGVANGTLTIDAHELASPVEVNYEIVTRRGKALLWLLLIGGVAAGWGTKEFLARRIARKERRAEGLELLRTLEDSRVQHPDATFDGKLLSLATRVETKLDGEPDPLKTVLEGVQTELAAAEKELSDRAAAVGARLAAARSAVEGGWTLPPRIAAVLQAAAPKLAALSSKLRDGYVGDVDEELRQLSLTLVRDLRGEFDRWRMAADGLALSTAGSSLAKAAPAVTAAATAAHTAIELVAGDRAAALATELEHIAAARAAIDDLLMELRLAIDVVVRQVLDAHGTDGPSAQAVSAAHAAMASALRDAGVQEPDRIAVPNQAREALETAMTAAIRAAQREHGGAAGVVDEALAKGDFAAAAKAAVLAAPGTGGEEVRQKSRAATAERSAGTVALEGGPLIRATHAPAVRSGRPASLTVGHRVTGRPAQALRETRKSLDLLRAVRDALLAAAVIVAGYLLFTDGWTGTTDDIVKVLAWAYGANVSAAFVTETLTRPAAPAPLAAPAAPAAPPAPAAPVAPAAPPAGGNPPVAA